MSTGFQPYLDITTASKAAGGPEALISARQAQAVIEATPALLAKGGAIGGLLGAVGGVGLTYVLVRYRQRRAAQRLQAAQEASRG